METRVALIVGSILLGCGCVGMLTVRVANPVLRGLGWLGGSFAAGATAAAISASRHAGTADSTVILTNTLILLGFVFLHVCILELFECTSLVPRLGIFLLCIQLVAFVVLQQFHQVQPLGTVILGLLVTVQALDTAALLKKTAKPGLLAPTWFSIAILFVFAAFNIFRAMVILIHGTPQDLNAANPFQLATVIVYLSTRLGIGFAIFWMTSSQIRVMLEQLANMDPLTGIHNRRSFVASCEIEALRSTRTDESFSLIMLDVDNFKQINDRHGHHIGDAVLCAVVAGLRDSVRNIDTVGRWGGEEFVALLPGANPEAAVIVAQRLRRKVESLVIPKPPSRGPSRISSGLDLSVTISLGVATYLGPPDTIEALLRLCDRAMYQAKAEGRNRVVYLPIQVPSGNH